MPSEGGHARVRRFLINVQDPFRLKVLFPPIRIAVGGVPAYGRLLYRDFEYALPDGVEMLLERSPAGFNIDTHLGLLGFLRGCEYMPPAKLARFELAGRGRVADSFGREITPEGIFHTDPDALNMVFYCSILKVSNKAFIDSPLEPGYILDVLESPLYARLREADLIGHGRLLERVLHLFDSFYSRDIKFQARGNGKASGFDRMAQLMNSFDRQGFKNFSLSGDARQDAYVLLSLFGER